MKAGFRGLSTLSHMMRISWHKTAIKQGKNGCKKAENTVIKIISDRTVSSSANQPKNPNLYILSTIKTDVMHTKLIVMLLREVFACFRGQNKH
jgi:hypothetical protein